MYAEAVSCYIYPEASCFTASFIGMQRNVHSLFQLEVFFFSCPRHVFAVFISASFPIFFTTLLAPSCWVLCDGKEPGNPLL